MNDGLLALWRRVQHTQRRVLVTTRRNLAAAEPYQAKRRCTTTGYCNDDEIAARGVRPQGQPVQAPRH